VRDSRLFIGTCVRAGEDARRAAVGADEANAGRASRGPAAAGDSGAATNRSAANSVTDAVVDPAARGRADATRAVYTGDDSAIT